ncbi:hypothetical protein CDV31_001261 [Fusarium ambrosium]|uniref:Uncharacterized protein n=1 Tax=Fusarium ambrosium TaxID=131363 RepID=A0A428V038_9HYPO|nr:hypothetical protein CDV31_001261 [Fusarium ambrosium]
MRFTTVAAAAAYFSTASALYLPPDLAQRYSQHPDNGRFYIKDPYYVSSDARPDPAEMIKLGIMKPIRPRPIKESTSEPEKFSPGTKKLLENITPPEDKKDKFVPDVEGCANAQNGSEESDRCVHYSHIQIHKAVPRSVEKRQKGPDPAKVDLDEPEDALTPLLGPILDQVGERYKPLIPKKLGVEENEATVTHVQQENGKVIIYPKSKPKQRNHEFLEGLIGKIGLPNKRSEASGAKDHGNDATKQKDCDKEKNDELLGNVIDKVEQRVKPQTPTFSKDKRKFTEGAGEKLIEDLIKKAEERARAQIPTEQGEVADDDEGLEDLLEQARLQHKTLEPRWSARLRQKASPLEKKIRKKQGKPEFGALRWSVFPDSNDDAESYPVGVNLRGYSREYLSGLLVLEFNELCRKNPENCIKPKDNGPREFTPITLEAKARLEDMKKYAMAHTSPDDFRAQRYLKDEKAENAPEIEFWISKKGVWYRAKYDDDEPGAQEARAALDERFRALRLGPEAGWFKAVSDSPPHWPGIIVHVRSG